MSEIFFRELEISPPNLNLQVGSGLHGAQTGKMLELIENALIKQAPDCVLVYGDTNSTLAGALAASKLNIPVCHIEAGLRSFNKSMPEEKNRIITDHLSDVLFVPTNRAKTQLLQEGINPNAIINSGDVMYDACLYYKDKSARNSNISHRLGLKNTDYILATIHRAENTDDSRRLKRIISDLVTLSSSYRVIFPLHPRTKNLMANLLQHLGPHNIEFIEPVGYLDIAQLETNSIAIITDSGGVQKEAFFHEKPCLTLRDETEWLELIESGWNKLYPPTDLNKEPILDAVQNLIASVPSYTKPVCYGTGNAAETIVSSLKDMYK